MKNKSIKLQAILIIILCVLGFCLSNTHAWQSDNGNGTFTNPVLYADYPDPDIIRVGSDFYMVSTTFVDSPGINVLHSQDLVNWEIISHAASTLDGGNIYNMIGGTAYRGGMWASSIRYYNGTFYIAVQPNYANGRIYYATNPAGPWNFYQLDRNIYDPGLFIDTDGTGYIICGHGPQSVMTLNSTYSAVVSQVTDLINSGGEGSHVVKRGSYYYLFNANPGVWPFQLRCSRATSILGTWETGHICLTATTGGHQGAIVDIDDSDHWYGFVHQDSGAVGRMLRIGPVFWENNWPVFGTTTNRDQMASTYTKPILGKPIIQPPTSDDFSASTMGLQWQWNHNPDNTRWSLIENPGYLRLRPTLASSFWTARNTLTQKGQGPQSNGVVQLDISNLQNGDIAGFGTLGEVNGYIYVTADASGNKTLGMVMDDRSEGVFSRASDVPFTGTTLYLRTDLNFQTNQGNCSYSADGTNWTSLGGYFPLEFDISTGTFQGEKYAIFCYNPNTASSTGYVDVDSFTFGTTANPVNTQRGRPVLNAARTTFVADNGQLLRGPYTSSEWGNPSPADQIANIKNLGFNAVHIYGECYDINYPDAGSTAPGYAASRIDSVVTATRNAGLYLIITIGNGANNGNYNYDYVVDFWNFYAPRYADETHVLYEIQNEPVAWGPPYSSASATPPGAVDMEVAAYNAIRSHAPDTPVLLFSYAVFGDSGGANAALTDINAFNTAVGGDPAAIWSKTAVGFHGYAGWKSTAEAVELLIAAGYPCFMTEFGDSEWGTGHGGFGVLQTSELERLEVSWLAFCYIPPSGVSDNVTIPEVYEDRVDRAGMSWAPDYGTWPQQRGVYGNGGQPRATTSTFVNNILTGTLRIQAEDFDTGGQNIAYNDTTTSNQGGQYRTGDGVDIESTSDTGAGYDIGWTADGEWLEYSIYVPEPGFYDLKLRVASSSTGCTARVICYNLDKTGTWAIPNTGGAQTWTTITKQVFLELGRQKLRVEILTGGFNLNWIELSPSATAPIANGTYKLVNQNSGQVIENDTSTHKLVQNVYSGANIQLWNLLHLGAGEYRVQSVQDNYYWNTWNSTMTWWWGTDAQSQRFIVRSIGNSYYRIIPVDSGVDYTVEDASLVGGAAIVSNEYTGLASQKWAILSSSAPAFPISLNGVWNSSSRADLTWTASSGATSYNVKRYTTSGGPYTTIAPNLTSTSYSDTNVTPGVTYYYVVSANTAGGESLNSNEAAVTGPWLSQDIGTVGVAGSSGYSDNVFTVNGSGEDIWSTADAFRFVYFPVTGDCTIVARVASVQNTNSWAKAGVMIRQSLDANSANAFIAVTPGNCVTWQYRSSAGGSTSNNGTTGLIAPYWVKLVRSGNTFTGYRSPDGTTWTQQGSSVTISMASGAYIGLAVTSHTNSNLCQAVFDNVTAPGWPKSIPAAPTGLYATSISPNITSLNWNRSAIATGYNVKRSTTSGGPYTTIAANVTSTGYIDTDIAAGTIYYYVVSAIGLDGQSADSAEVTPAILRTYLKFNESSGTTASDAAGNNWTGTLVNGPLWSTSGKYNNAVDLDGTNDYVSLPTGVVNGLTTCTISTWVYLDAAGTWSRVFDFGTGTSNYMFLTGSSGSTVRFAIRTASVGEQVINGTSALPTAAWTHVAVTLSGSLGILYVNGAEVGRNSAMTLTPSSLGSTTQNYIGKSQFSADAYVNGRVDDFRIYTSGVSAAQVAALYAATLPSAPASLSAAAISAGQINLTWAASSGAVYYNVKRSTTSGGPYTTITSLSGTSFSDTGLSETTAYYYVVSAVSSIDESANSTQASATTLGLPPAIPSGLTATAGNSTVTLSWNANSESDLAGYNVYRSTTSGSGYTLRNSILLTSPEFTDNTVTNNVTYYYVVTAVDTGANESTYSNEVSAMPFDNSLVQLSGADFESGFGDWVNVTGDDTNDWTRNSGGTTTPNTGPTGGASGSTWYVYLETSPGGANTAGNTAILQSPQIHGDQRTLTFYYHMYGSQIGTLNVDVYDGTWHTAVWSLSGQQQTSENAAYIQATVDLSGYTGTIQIRFRAIAAGGTFGDMALDNIAVTGGLLYGDMNADNIVNADDLPEFAGYWLQDNSSMDLNADGMINLYEFTEFAENWLDDSYQ